MPVGITWVKYARIREYKKSDKLVIIIYVGVTAYCVQHIQLSP